MKVVAIVGGVLVLAGVGYLGYRYVKSDRFKRDMDGLRELKGKVKATVETMKKKSEEVVNNAAAEVAAAE